MKAEILKELILQSLEHEMGGVKIYETALQCAQNEDLKEEWERYHEETQKHVDILRDVCTQMHYDPDEETPGRRIAREKGEALVAAMESALEEGDEEVAQVVACESVLVAELVDHTNWQLIGEAAKHLDGAEGKALKEAYQEVEDQEDEHYYHTKGWMRELSLEGLGLKAVLPPPEEKQKVKSAMEAAKVEQSRRKSR